MKYLLCFLLPITLFACSKKDCCVIPPTTDLLFFGKVYGMCIDDCARVYKLQDGALYADDGVMNYNDLKDPNFLEIPMPQSKYELAKGLIENLPARLLEEEKDRIGCPDCADQGALWLVFQPKDGERKEWFIDTDVSALPDYLQTYAEQLGTVISDLK